MEQRVAINLRLPQALHQRLTDLARRERRSLNEQIVYLLETHPNLEGSRMMTTVTKGTKAFAARINWDDYRDDKVNEVNLLYFANLYDAAHVACRTRKELLLLGARPEDIRPATVYRPGEEPEGALYDEDGTPMVEEDNSMIGAHECDICGAAGQVTPATRYALGRHLCDACAAVYEAYLQPGERLEDMTQEEMDRRIYSN